MRDPLLVLVFCAFTSQVVAAVMKRLERWDKDDEERKGEAGMRDWTQRKECLFWAMWK